MGGRRQCIDVKAGPAATLVLAAALWTTLCAVSCRSDAPGNSGTGGRGSGGMGAAAGAGGAPPPASSGGAIGSGGATGAGGSSGASNTGGAVASGGSAATGGSAGGGGTNTGTAGMGGGGVAGGAMAGRGGGGPGGMGGQGGAINGGAGGGLGGGTNADATFCVQQLNSAAQHYQGFRQAYPNAAQIPRSASGTTPRLVGVSDWTSGFPAGSFWLLFEHTKDPAWRTAAEARTAALDGQRLRTDTHDVGFVINNTYGAGLRLTQNAAYRSVLLAAAQSLSTRFNATVGAIKSWNDARWTYPVIIDNMMNLELLFRATAEGGAASFRANAITHAVTTMTNHFRADASSYHVVDYNPTTGAVIRKQTNQGVADESAWARGQAWGLYGYAMCHRETQDTRFLEHAIRIADFYTQSPDMPADGVPYFDFQAPRLANVPDHRDASAGAIAASALFELARLAPAPAATRYRAFAIKVVRSLSSPAYRAALGANAHFLLMHSVGNYPISDEVDVAMNYADYYYLEALLRCAALN